jgi:hypothetical protein
MQKNWRKIYSKSPWESGKAVFHFFLLALFFCDILYRAVALVRMDCFLSHVWITEAATKTIKQLSEIRFAEHTLPPETPDVIPAELNNFQ